MSNVENSVRRVIVKCREAQQKQAARLPFD
jgi:hypothetical protein